MTVPSRDKRGTEPRVVLERDQDDELDDVVIRDVWMFRMERMDDGHIWAACYLDGEDDVVFQITGKPMVWMEAERQ